MTLSFAYVDIETVLNWKWQNERNKEKKRIKSNFNKMNNLIIENKRVICLIVYMHNTNQPIALINSLTTILLYFNFWFDRHTHYTCYWTWKTTKIFRIFFIAAIASFSFWDSVNVSTDMWFLRKISNQLQDLTWFFVWLY